MKIIQEISLQNFELRRQDEQVRDLFTCEELDQLESILEATYPDGLYKGDVEYYFEDNGQRVCELLGIDYENDFKLRGE